MERGWFETLRDESGVTIEYPDKVPISNGMVEFEVITVFPRELDVALVEVYGLNESFREVIYNSDTSIILVDFVNPPPGRHEFNLRVYQSNTIVYSYKFQVEFVGDPLGIVYAVAERGIDGKYSIRIDLEIREAPIELFVEASSYQAFSYYDKVLEREEKIVEKGYYSISLGEFNLEDYSLEIVLVCIREDLEWKRIIVLPQIT